MPNSTQTKPNLSKFAETHDEAVFAEIVEEFGGLVYSGAIRRTGDRGLAEEVTQNVFAALAGKAAALADHPSLSGWLFTTTKLEAARAMRARKRHVRKMEALASEISADSAIGSTEEEAWRDALPELYSSLDRLGRIDREVLLARFFSGQSFSEIAETTGTSEAACKMRVRRSLDKLQGWLSARGVVLSTTALAAGLSEEFANAAPAALVKTLSANVLAAVPGAAGGILTNSIIAMNISKSAIAAAAVLTVASVPFFIQSSESRELRERIAVLGAASPPQLSPLLSSQTGKAEPPQTPVQQFFSKIPDRLSADELMEQLVEAMKTRDMTKVITVFVPLAQLTDEELRSLMDEVAASDRDAQTKGMTLNMLGELDTSHSFEKLLDRALTAGLERPANVAQTLSEWAREDFPAAYAWFEKHKASGALQGRGLGRPPEVEMQIALAVEAVNHDPDLAVELVSTLDAASRSGTVERLVGSLAKAGGVAREKAIEIITEASGLERDTLARGAIMMIKKSAPDEVAGFVEKLPDGLPPGLALDGAPIASVPPEIVGQATPEETLRMAEKAQRMAEEAQRQLEDPAGKR